MLEERPFTVTRPDGLPLLKREYGFNPSKVRTVDISLRYKPIEDGQANCVYAFGTDPKLGQLDLGGALRRRPGIGESFG